MNAEESASTDYVRRLHEEVIGWYKSADNKAQVLLVLNGAFLSFITSAIIMDPGELATVVDWFGIETWIFLGVMIVSLVGSVYFALACLWSRTSFAETRNFVRDAGVLSKSSEPYPPDVMWFFGHIQHFESNPFKERIQTVTPEFERQALAIQIWRLSRNVFKKHQMVNWGFTLAGGSLGGLLGAVVSYFTRTVL